MSEHTTGPWVVGESHTSEPAIREPHGECVAVACQTPSRSETGANARLIAAAPELLAALRKVLQLSSCSPSCMCGRCYDAQIAISKAVVSDSETGK